MDRRRRYRQGACTFGFTNSRRNGLEKRIIRFSISTAADKQIAKTIIKLLAKIKKKTVGFLIAYKVSYGGMICNTYSVQWANNFLVYSVAENKHNKRVPYTFHFITERNLTLANPQASRRSNAADISSGNWNIIYTLVCVYNEFLWIYQCDNNKISKYLLHPTVIRLSSRNTIKNFTPPNDSIILMLNTKTVQKKHLNQVCCKTFVDK